jgi:alpha/beta superfamily hydrolase
MDKASSTQAERPGTLCPLSLLEAGQESTSLAGITLSHAFSTGVKKLLRDEKTHFFMYKAQTCMQHINRYLCYEGFIGRGDN